MRRGYTVQAHVKTTPSPTGQPVLTEAGAAVAGTAGEQSKQVS
jgi:hypothetical protein